MLLNKGSQDIWVEYQKGHYVCIATNGGWDKNGLNVMGAGMARQAADRFRNIRKDYGSWLQNHPRMAESAHAITDVEIISDENLSRYCNRLIFVCTKPLQSRDLPHLSWNAPCKMETIRENCVQMEIAANSVSLQLHPIQTTLLGTGCGGLDPKEVFEVMNELLSDRFMLTDIAWKNS